MDDQTLSDIAALLDMCRDKLLLSSERATLEEIKARYKDEIRAMSERNMIAKGWARNGDTWSKIEVSTFG